MKHWWCALALLLVAACGHMAGRRDSAFDCGIPVLTEEPIGGRIAIDAQLAPKLQQQLPAKISVDAGCWEQMSDGHLEGTYAAQETEKGYTVEVYVFEYRDGAWVLASTRHELQIWHRRR